MAGLYIQHMLNNAIEVTDLKVIRGGKYMVLPGLRLCQCPRGSVTGLLGPSGSGKTTFGILWMACIQIVWPTAA